MNAATEQFNERVSTSFQKLEEIKMLLKNYKMIKNYNLLTGGFLAQLSTLILNLITLLNF